MEQQVEQLQKQTTIEQRLQQLKAEQPQQKHPAIEQEQKKEPTTVEQKVAGQHHMEEQALLLPGLDLFMEVEEMPPSRSFSLK